MDMKKPVLVQYPDEFLQLQKEAAEHPELMKLMKESRGNDLSVENFFGTIAAYCDIILDDAYHMDDLIDLCDVLIRKLKEKRKSIILIH